MNSMWSFIIVLVSLTINGVQSKSYTTTNNKTYYIDEQYSYNWYEAHLECSSRDMALVTFDSKEKYVDVIQLLKSGIFVNKPPSVWVGAVGYRKKFSWILNGKPIIPSLWCDICPNDNPKNENCVEVWGNQHGLNDLSCDAKIGFICEDRVNPNSLRQKYENMIINLVQRN